jgi:hypothetical protein
MNTQNSLSEAPVVQIQAAAPEAPPVPSILMMCEVCDLVGGPFAPEEAALLRAVHDRMHHGITTAAA